MDEPPVTRRRWTAFSLRTLMIVVTVGAIASWIYWTAWPRWKIYREQAAVEAGAKQLKIGSTAFEGMQFVPGKREVSTSYSSTTSRKLYGRTDYVWPNAMYCILYTYPDGYSGGMSSATCTSVALYRLPLPDNRIIKREAEAAAPTDKPYIGQHPELSVYLSNFTEFVLSDGKSQLPPFQFELLHSDFPTAK